MAFDDTLFQLGMDLAQSSSTAQKEEKAYAPVPPEDDRRDHFIELGIEFPE